MSMSLLVEHFFNNIPKDKYGIDLMEFEEKMITGSINDYFLLDIRQEHAFKAKRIAGSINISYLNLGNKLNLLPEDKKIIVISKDGILAAQISSLLNACGFQAWVLREGIEGYIDVGGEIEYGN